MIINRWDNHRTPHLAKAMMVVVVALGILLSAAGGEINAAAVPYQLSSNTPSFFHADHATGATYYKYDTTGMYVLIGKEHMGVWPLDGGKWVQASNGIMTMTSTNQRAGPPETVAPMTYKKRVFLVWPGKDYKADAQRVCRVIDAETNAPRVFNELMISAEEFSEGTATPYRFKFYKGMNKVTGAEE